MRALIVSAGLSLAVIATTLTLTPYAEPLAGPGDIVRMGDFWGPRPVRANYSGPVAAIEMPDGTWRAVGANEIANADAAMSSTRIVLLDQTREPNEATWMGPAGLTESQINEILCVTRSGNYVAGNMACK